MTIPYSNTTCDIYRAANTPPSAPDVAGVNCALTSASQNIKPIQAGIGQYSHILLVNPTVDIRDNGDKVYVPDQNGTLFLVVWVARVGRGTALDHLEVLLNRQNPTYPTNNL